MNRILVMLLLSTIGLGAFAQSTSYVSFSSGSFYAIDWQNCHMRFIGSAEFAYKDIAFTSDGRLWGISPYGDLKQIDTANASTISSMVSMPPTNALIGLNDSLLLAQGDERLSTINVNTGANHFIEYTGFNSDGDFAKVDDAFYITSEGLLIRMELNATYDSVLSKSVINDSINAPMPKCFGLIQSTLPFEEDILIGFADTAIYRINIANGSYSHVCDVRSVEEMWGAAYWNPSSNPTEITEKEFHNLSSWLFPNPVDQNQSVYIRLSEKQKRDLVAINIYSIQGKLIYRSKRPEFFFSDELKIDIAPLNLPSGIFVVEIMTESGRSHALLKVE
jgi:hypothetical protein